MRSVLNRISSDIFMAILINIIAVSCITVAFIWFSEDKGYEPFVVLLSALFVGLTTYRAHQNKKVTLSEFNASDKKEAAVWNHLNEKGTIIPNLLILTSNFINRPKYEKALEKSIINFPVTTLVGLSGIGKSYISSYVLQKMRSKGVFQNVWYFENTPSKSVLELLLTDIANKNECKSYVEYLVLNKNILVFDNFQESETEYVEFVNSIIRHTDKTKFLFVSTVEIHLIFPEMPNSIANLIIDEGFTKTEFKKYINVTKVEKKFQDLPFEKAYSLAGRGLPRAAANLVTSIERGTVKIAGKLEYEDYWTAPLLSNLNKQEIKILEIVCVANSAFPIKIVESLLTGLLGKKLDIGIQIENLVSHKILEQSENGDLNVHSIIRSAIKVSRKNISEIHNYIAKYYIADYQLRNHNPDRIETKELLDKRSALYHSYLGENYKLAAHIYSEIHVFFSGKDKEMLHDYLPKIYEKTKKRHSWISYLYALHLSSKKDYSHASDVVDLALRQKTNTRVALFLITLKAAIDLECSRTNDSIILASENLDYLTGLRKNHESYRFSIIYSTDLDRLIIWNLWILKSAHTEMNDSEKVKYYENMAEIETKSMELKKTNSESNFLIR